MGQVHILGTQIVPEMFRSIDSSPFFSSCVSWSHEHPTEFIPFCLETLPSHRLADIVSQSVRVTDRQPLVKSTNGFAIHSR
jgi:hypothetical protein